MLADFLSINLPPPPCHLSEDFFFIMLIKSLEVEGDILHGIIIPLSHPTTTPTCLHQEKRLVAVPLSPLLTRP
jgi:hypothetical protein